MTVQMKIKTTTVRLKTVDLTTRIARQLDIIHSFTEAEFNQMVFVGRISGQALFGRDYDWEYILVEVSGISKLLSNRYSALRHATEKLPKLVLTS